MVGVNDCRWGSYMQYEGPAFYGGRPVTLKPNSTFVEKVVAVVAATEGKFASINMYDSCIVSVGIMQYCERSSGKVTEMIGEVANSLGVEYVNTKLADALKISGAVFKKNASGVWKFFLLRDGKELEVNPGNSSLQQQLYLGCDGKKGNWTSASRNQARIWCAGIASLWESQDACDVQYKFCCDRILKGYTTNTAKTALFNDVNSPDNGWGGALKAICVSYAVNRPVDAEKMLVLGMSRSKYTKWSKGWCLDIIRTFASDSGIGLWPIRYNSIRKTVETAFGIVLPQTVRELSMRPWDSDPTAGEVIKQIDEVNTETDASIPVTLNEVTIEGEVSAEPQHASDFVENRAPTHPVQTNTSPDFHPIMFVITAIGTGFFALLKFIDHLFHLHK